MLAECASHLRLDIRVRAAREGICRLLLRGAVLALLLPVLLHALPAAAAGAPASCSLGPWQLGMTREQVTAFEAFGPYTDVWETGGVETHKAPTAGISAGPAVDAARANVSFVFDGAGLKYMLLFKYEGRDYKAAKTALLDLFDEFQRNYGGATLEDFTVQGPAADAQLDHRVLADLLEQVLGEAHAVGERALKDQEASVSMMFDLAPKQQPCATRVHVQWGYHSKYDTYYVLLYQDRMDAEPRSIDKNFRLGPP